MASENLEMLKMVVGSDFPEELLKYALEKKNNDVNGACEALFSREITMASIPKKPDPSTNPFSNASPSLTVTQQGEMSQRFVACFVLSGAGDAIGYKNGKFEFNKNGMDIHRQVFEMGGLERIDVGRGWKVSDDTVMHLATAQALIEWKSSDVKDLFPLLCKYYIDSGKDMEGRAPGEATMTSLMLLEGVVPYEGRKITPKKWNEIPFMPKGGGCGGAMRAMCIGLRFFGDKNRDLLTSVSIESARMTHNHPCAFLGAFNSALFTAFAIEGKPIGTWGKELLKELPRAEAYVKSVGRDYDKYKSQEGNYSYFENQWLKYLNNRGLLDSDKPIFPKNYGIKERDDFYKSVSFDGWGGSSGHDINIIAYDALLGCNGNWEEMCKRGVLHYGDSDSTGAICAAWFGAVYGFKSVFEVNYKNLEYKNRLVEAGQTLFYISGLADK